MTTARHRDDGVRGLLRSVSRGHRKDWVGIGLWSAVEGVPVYLYGRMVANAVDRGFLAGRAAVGFAWLAVLALTLLVGAWATRQTFRRLAALVEPLRDELVTRSVSGCLVRATAAGVPPDTAAAARLSQHTEIVREASASVLMVSQGFAVASAGAVLGLLSLAPVYLLLVVPPLVVGLALFVAALPRLADCQRRAILAEERIAETGSQLVLGITDVVACGGERRMAERVGVHVEAHAAATQALARLTAVRTSAVAIGGWVPLVLILVAGPWLLTHGSTPGVILGALTYVYQVLHPALESLVRGIGGPGLWLVVTLRRILATTQLPPTAQTRPERAGQALATLGTPGELRLRGVTFAYGAAAAPVVHDLDLSIPAGEHVAIVGPSGAGKSTLAGLLTGMLTPDAGEVRLGGVPLRTLGPQALAQCRVLVPHDAYVFAGSVRENLGYLRPDVLDVELDAVVSAFGLPGLLDELGGYDAPVDPAVLSAGRRQLLALARAYLAPAPIAVLDEATCHLDATTEERVETLFAQRGGTLVVVAHRISSAVRAERVLVVDSGTVTTGRHQDLLAMSALYADLTRWWEWSGSARRETSSP